MFEVMSDTPQWKFVLQWEQNKPFAHLEVYEWGVGIYKQLLSLWKTTLKSLWDRNYPFIYTCIPVGDEKLRKFQHMFCLEEVEQTDKYVLLYASTDV